jgi:TolB-like protein/tetratricopeptide (TPR) repeat protein
MNPLGVIGAFARELRRRHVFKVAVVYGAVAFILVQVADLVFAPLGLPDWTYTLVVVLAIMGFPLALILAWAFDLTPEGVQRTGSTNASRTGAADARTKDARPPGLAVTTPVAKTAVPSSIVILPFANLSADPEDEYFSDGVTEDIRARVASLGALRVISRTSAMRYKGTDKSPPLIAAELGVAYVMEGSVRRTPDRVRIVVQLVDPATDLHLWSETFDRKVEDVFEIQSQVARQVAGALETGLSFRGGDGRARAPTTSLEAYDLYLRARHEWGRRTPQALEWSLEYLARAVELDPSFALAHAARADSWLTLAVYGEARPREAMEQARSAVDRALDLDADLAPALTARACVRALHDWDGAGAEDDFRRAIGQDPQYVTARQWYAMNFLVPRARFQEARHELDRCLELDPLSPVLEVSLGVLEFYGRAFDDAVSRLRRLVQREDGFVLGRTFLGLALVHGGRLPEGRNELALLARAAEASPEVQAALATACALGGDVDEARRIMEELDREGERRYLSPVLTAQVSAALGDAEGAAARLDQAVAERAVDLAWTGVHPVFDPLREHPGFREIRRTVLGSDASSAPGPPASDWSEP